jgi:uncharacterized YccA/Bax inhibitor family protein
MRTSNPALRDEYFRRDPAAVAADGVMTLQGTATRSFVLVLLVIFSAAFTWREVRNGNTGILMPAILVGGLGGFIVAMVTIFKPRLAPITSPFYAVLEGLLLGAISARYQAFQQGLPMQAVGLTCMVFLAMLIVYRTGLIKVTDKLRFGIAAATGGIALFYLLSFVLSFFGVGIPLVHGSGTIGIVFSLIVVGVAAMNLVLDFDLIENGVRAQAPKYMEWYAAFGLLVTLVWLYLELLRLLSKLQRR